MKGPETDSEAIKIFVCNGDQVNPYLNLMKAEQGQ